jgi:hypothetical protein
MNDEVRTTHIISLIFATAVFAIGVLNLILVHAVPGVIYLLLSLVYFPPTNVLMMKKFGFSISLVVKIILGIFIVMFTLGVSDLGNMIDSSGR